MADVYNPSDGKGDQEGPAADDRTSRRAASRRARGGRRGLSPAPRSARRAGGDRISLSPGPRSATGTGDHDRRRPASRRRCGMSGSPSSASGSQPRMERRRVRGRSGSRRLGSRRRDRQGGGAPLAHSSAPVPQVLVACNGAALQGSAADGEAAAAAANAAVAAAKEVQWVAPVGAFRRKKAGGRKTGSVAESLALLREQRDNEIKEKGSARVVSALATKGDQESLFRLSHGKCGPR